jgi:AcrR family transcriptional regulator
MLNSVAENTRRRLTADDRRRQLVGIGLRMLATVPIHQLPVDAVAAEAGISRGLLFHYFPTKRDFYVAVIRAAGRRLLRQTRPDPSAPPADQLRQVLTAYVAFVERRRDAYISWVRGAAGGDTFVVEVYDETRAELTARVVALVDGADSFVVHAWWAYVEDLAIEWAGATPRALSAGALVDHAIAALQALHSTPMPITGRKR